MLLNAIADKLKRQLKEDFKGRHFEGWPIVQAVSCSLCYPLSYRALEDTFPGRGVEIDNITINSTINRRVLAFAPLIERRLRQFRKPPRVSNLCCGGGKALAFPGDWTVNNLNDLLARIFGLQQVNKA